MKKKLLILFTAVYLLCEVIYNLGLVEFLSSKNTEISVFENLETFGKVLSSIGLSLIFIMLVKNSKTKLIAFAVLVPVLYMCETFGFHHLVDSLPTETKVAGYYSGVYRNAVINGSIPDSQLSELTPYNRVMLSNIMALSTNKDVIRKKVDELLYKAPESKEIVALYSNYQKLTSTIEPYYSTYAITSKRWGGFEGKAKEAIDKEFIKRSGLPQGLNKEQFYSAVAEKSPSFKAYLETVIIPGDEKFGIAEIKGKDIPLGMNQEQFKVFVELKIKDILSKTAINEANFDKLPHSYNLISSVFIPPLAIFLSLLSIILNASILCIEISSLVKTKVLKLCLYISAGIPTLVAVAVFSASTFNPYKLSEPLNRIHGIEATLYEALNPVASLIHSVAINDVAPNEGQIVRIKKPEAINFSDLEAKMGELKSISNQELPTIDERITADSERLENDKSYFGEVKTNINPYTGQSQ